MHREFRELLTKARGYSEWVVAVCVDARGFTAFSTEVESPGVAMFVKRVYMKLIDEYFPDKSFFKPAGDGLLLTIPFTEESLDEVVVKTVTTSLRLLTEFGSFCDNDPMINFEVPREVGIGLSRGVACCLMSGHGDKVLDYSGRVLNLASRLTDVARPGGVVFDAAFGTEGLSGVLAESFARDSIYVKGIAQQTSIDVFYTKEYTRISPVHKRPIEEVEWKTVRDTKTLKQIKECSEVSQWFRYVLPSDPIDPDQILVRATHPMARKGRRTKGRMRFRLFDDFRYGSQAGKPMVYLDFPAIASQLTEDGCKSSWPVLIEIMYQEQWA